jgi:hypothetical protein
VISSDNATSQYVTLNGTIVTPVIYAPSVATLNNLNYYIGSGPSTSQGFSISAANLASNLSITAGTDFEASTSSSSGFGNAVSITPVAGNVTAALIYVRLKSGLSLGNYNNESVTINTTGTASTTVTTNGAVSPRPTTYTENFTTTSLSTSYNTTTFTTNLGTWTSGGGGCGTSSTGIFGTTLKLKTAVVEFCYNSSVERCINNQFCC